MQAAVAPDLALVLVLVLVLVLAVAVAVQRWDRGVAPGWMTTATTPCLSAEPARAASGVANAEAKGGARSTSPRTSKTLRASSSRTSLRATRYSACCCSCFRRSARAVGRSLMPFVPQWMTEIPPDLNGKGGSKCEGWYVFPRPEGRRCLVTASKGTTVARDANGGVLGRFQSALPCGSRRTNRGRGNYCILDCIFNFDTSTYYVLDLLCWKVGLQQPDACRAA